MKGSRLPSDWTLPAEWRAWSLEERPDLDPEKMADCFRDYWISVPGQKGVKLNWHATWRNWVRRQKQLEKPAGKQQSHSLVTPKRTSKDEWDQYRETAAGQLEALRKAAKGLL